MTTGTAVATRAATRVPMRTLYAGFGPLLRLAWRRDRILMTVSVLALGLVAYGTAAASIELVPDPNAIDPALAAVYANPSVVAMYGPLAALTLGALATFKAQLMGAIFVTILGYAIVRRHTRIEEEDGRLELLGAGAVGRRAPVAVAVTLASLAVLAAALLAVISLVALGLDARGSAAFGLAWVTPGLAFVGVTAVTAQLASSARGVAGLTLGLLALAYLVRMVADSAGIPWLQWLSPFGWAERISAYGRNDVWVALLGLGAVVVLTALAFRLLERRDLGAGLIPARAGAAHGRIGSVEGLLARLTRGSFLGWILGYAVLGGIVGSLVGSVGDIASDPKIADMLRKLGGGVTALEDVFLSTEIAFAAAAATAAGIAVAGRLGADERAMRTEAVLALPVARVRWFLSHAAYAMALPATVLAVGGLVMGVNAQRVLGTPQVGRVLVAALATLPAVLLVVAVALLLQAISPRLGWAGWAFLAVAFLLGELGTTMRLPEWLVNLSPFAHFSRLPGGTFEVTPTVVLLVLAVAAAVLGAVVYRRRDIT